MKTRTWAMGLSALLALSLAVACSDDDEKKDSGTHKLDSSVDVDKGTADDTGTTPDQTVTTPDKGAPPITTMGKGCKATADCKSAGAVCLHWTNIFTYVSPSPQGLCTKKCKKDNPDTPLVDEDDCPKNFKCAEFDFGSSKPTYCLQTCTVSATKNPCDASSGLTCHPTSTRWTSGTKNVCFYPACKTNKNCPVFISEKSCSSDADCTKIKSGSFCESSSSKCAMPGNCLKSGLCGKHTHGKATAKVGDPCKSDGDCPGNGSCLTPSTSTSSIGESNPNGYCTVPYCKYSSVLTDYACPTGSTCHQLYYGGLCFKTCTLADAKSCRGYKGDKGGDYECYAWDNLYSSSSKKVTEKPVCMSTANWSCKSLGTKLDCSALGIAKTNTTKMACRDRTTGVVKSSKADPKGVCMDNTASGAFPKPDAGVPPAKDTGVPPAKDTGVPPAKDTGTPPAKDTGTPPAKDTSVPPAKDTSVPPAKDAGAPQG